MNDETRALLLDFVDEAMASLQPLATQLATYRRQPSDAAPIHGVFRAIHSIKGCAGFLGLGVIQKFSHSLENTLDEVRNGKIALSEPLETALIRGFDVLAEQITETLEERLPDALGPREEETLALIGSHANVAAEDPEVRLLNDLRALAEEMARDEHPLAQTWSGRLQTMIGPTGDADADEEFIQPPTRVRPAASFACSTFVTHELDVTPLVRAVLQLFLHVAREPFTQAAGRAFEEACQELSRAATAANAVSLAECTDRALADFRKLAASPLTIDSDLLSIVWDPWCAELVRWEQQPSQPAAPLEAEASGPAAAPPPTVAPAHEANAKPARFIRIKEEHLDEFLNHVSSLFITGELLKDLHARLGASQKAPALSEELRTIIRALAAQSTALQQGVVGIRRVSVSALFAKFPRMARGLAEKMGKRIDVHVSGEEVEIDKSLVDDLDSPLTHMIRNVADHGIETPAERLKRGMPETGNLWLRAEQSRTHIRIYVQDDGRGIDPKRLRAKAVEKGLITRAQADALGDQDAVDLIFHAGFSTAEKLTDVSGRGVGMDVVRTSVREHNGEVTVSSRPGVGTTFCLEIPIRTAVLVIDGLLLQQGGQSFVLPFEHILELTEICAGELTSIQGAHVARIRGKTYDALSLGRILDLPSRARSSSERMQAVLLGSKQGTLCLLVDEVLGHRQVVVNSLSEVLPGHDRIAGVAQLGGGRLALVLSVPDIIKSLRRSG